MNSKDPLFSDEPDEAPPAATPATPPRPGAVHVSTPPPTGPAGPGRAGGLAGAVAGEAASPASVAPAPASPSPRRPAAAPPSFSPRQKPPERPARPAAAQRTPTGPAGLDRAAIHDVPVSRTGRLLAWTGLKLKSSVELEEDDVDRALSSRHSVGEPNIAVFTSPKGGPGKSTLTVTTGDAIARNVRTLRVLAVDFNPGGGVLSLISEDTRRAQRSMLELYEARHEIRSAAQIQPYVSSLPSGLDILAVPPDPRLAKGIKPEHYAELFQEVLLPAYDLLLLDTSPDITTPVTEYALSRGHQMICVCEQNYLTAKVVDHALGYLLETPAGRQTTLAFNRVLNQAGAGRIAEVQAQMRAKCDGPQVVIPFDAELNAALASGRYHLPGVRHRATRLPLKQLALRVVERLV